MNRKWFLIAIIVVVVLFVAAVVGLGVWFESPGVRVFLGDFHAEVSSVGYIIDSATGEVLGQTPVTVDGSTGRSEPNSFDGELTVLGYQNFSNGTITATKVVETAGEYYIINHLESCTHSEQDDNGITKEVEHFCDYYYTWFFRPSDPEFLIVAVEDFEEENTYYVVCTPTEGEALQTYEWFQNNRPE